ncbi:MAG: acyloxyacyl hydrolase [Elainellaceae cyanobacterium]
MTTNPGSSPDIAHRSRPSSKAAKAASQSSQRRICSLACLAAASAAIAIAPSEAWAIEPSQPEAASETESASEASTLGEVPNVAPPEAAALGMERLSASSSAIEVAQDVPPSEDNAETEAFGARGSDRWYIQGGAATTFDNEFALAGAGLSHFFANGHSINAELNGMAFSQEGDDAVGANLNVLLRYHFVRQENWSLYVDGGAGILGTTDNVPSGGSSFNFTPQAGGGATIRLSDAERLMVGLRWHHISNANTFDSNPGRDSVMGYVGLNLPR